MKTLYLYIASILLFTSYAYILPITIVYIHLGDEIPAYAYVALEQARLFNEHIPICLIANRQAITTSSYNFNAHTITTIACEDLPQSEWHKAFSRTSRLDRRGRNGFWYKATERFFYLHEYMKSYNATNVVHLEYDNMLYASLNEMNDIFALYKGIGAVFDNDDRCIPSILYISNQDAIEHLTQFISAHAAKGYNDMHIIARYHATYDSTYIDNLPLIMPDYCIDHMLINAKKQKPSNPAAYYNHIDRFNSIFDAAAFGQYLGGIDPRNGHSVPGFINETCLFNPSMLTIEWRIDEKQRKVPYALCKEKAYRINNLHIHSKNLDAFRS